VEDAVLHDGADLGGAQADLHALCRATAQRRRPPRRLSPSYRHIRAAEIGGAVATGREDLPIHLSPAPLAEAAGSGLLARMRGPAMSPATMG